MISAEDFDALIISKRRSKSRPYQHHHKCAKGEPCPGEVNAGSNEAPRASTIDPEPSRFIALTPGPYERATFRNTYQRQILDLSNHMKDVESEIEAYERMQQAGSTGLGPLIDDGIVMHESLRKSIVRTQAKAAFRRQPDSVVRAAYEHMVNYHNAQGLSHPLPHPLNPTKMTKLGMIEALTEDYNVPAGDLSNMPGAYPI